jgi:hypothetical protein
MIAERKLMTDQELKDKVVSILNEQAVKDARVRGAWTNAEPSLEIVEQSAITRMRVSVEVRQRRDFWSKKTAATYSSAYKSLPWGEVDLWDYLNDDWLDDSYHKAATFWEECTSCHNHPAEKCESCHGTGRLTCTHCDGRGEVET